MFQNMNPTGRETATIEIMIMLVGAFLLGYAWRWWQTKEQATAQKASPNSTTNDLTSIDGIGPKTEQVLNEAGIYSFKQLASTTTVRLQEILDRNNIKYKSTDIPKWIKQAASQKN